MPSPSSPRPFLLPIAFALAAASAGAQGTDPPDDGGAPIHWAFAPTLGTGYYQIGDVRTFVINAPFHVTVLEREEDEIGLKILLPVTAGLYDFDLDDILEGEFPTRLATLTVTPGVQAELPVGDSWIMRPTTQVGAGWEFEGGESALLYSGGIDALHDFSWGSTDFTFLGGASYHTYNPSRGASDDFTRLQAGLDVDVPLGWNAFQRELSLRPHTLVRYYAGEPARDFVNVTTSFEFGLSLGFEPELDLFGLAGVSRIGLGYTISDHAHLFGIRLLLGDPF